MRIGNRSRSFLTHGKTLFKKISQSSSNDESIRTEEHNTQSHESDSEQTHTKNTGTPLLNSENMLIELGRKISPLLTNFRKTIEESKTHSNSRDWINNAMSILLNCVQISDVDCQHNLKNLFLDIARIIYSTDRVGKASLSIEPTLELYSILCCIVADFLTGKPNKAMFEQWRTKYDKITQQFSTLGIRLVDDNEETISTEIKTNNLSENNNIDDGTVTQHPELPSENLSESSTTSDAVTESGQDVPLKNSETADYEGVNEQEINHSFSPEESSLSDSSDPSDSSDSSDSSDTAETSTQTQPHETPSIPDLNTLLKNITPYPSEAVIALVHETLKAIAEGTHETAKIKALELATEMAKLEVEKVTTEMRSTEFQMENIASEINQVCEQLNICKTDIENIKTELKEQGHQLDRTIQEKKNMEENILNTKNRILDIDNKILELQQQKEIELLKLREYENAITTTENTIQEYNQCISSLQESIQDYENQLETLQRRINSLESLKLEMEQQLKRLSCKIKERELIVVKLEETKKILEPASKNLADTKHNTQCDLQNGSEHQVNDLFHSEV